MRTTQQMKYETNMHERLNAEGPKQLSPTVFNILSVLKLTRQYKLQHLFLTHILLGIEVFRECCHDGSKLLVTSMLTTFCGLKYTVLYIVVGYLDAVNF